MDVQRVVVDRYPDPGYLPRLGEAIGAARAGGLRVIYVVVGFRPGYPEISTRNKMFSRLARTAGAAGSDEATQVHPDVAPEPGDVLVTKRRVSAFAGSDLDMVLRAGDIDRLVLTGIATSGVVLSTVRQAADLDFGLTVLADGCLDADPEVHRVLTEKVFPHQADVTTVADWVAAR
jgi:nicotinamidase-related amidase